MPASTAPPPGFLPAPRLPHSFDRTAPSLDQLRDLGLSDQDLSSLAEAADAYVAATAARDRLESARPGGVAWKRALDEDLAAVDAGGELPRRMALEKLAGGEHRRYTLAHARARLVAVKRKAALADQELRERIATAAETRMTSTAETFAESAEAAWTSRSTTSTAWSHYERAGSVLGAWYAARKAAFWARGEQVPSARGRSYLDGELDAPDPVSAGHYLAVGRLLKGSRAWMLLPQRVEWPAGWSADGVEASGPGVTDLYAGKPRPIVKNAAQARLNELRS